MERAKYKGKKEIVLTAQNPINKKAECRCSVCFFVFCENKRHIAYCPSLDLSTSGDTFNEAVGNFYEALQLYIECGVENNTLHDDLTAHGWTFKKEKITPPPFKKLMVKAEVKKLMDGDIGFEKIVAPTRMPTFV